MNAGRPSCRHVFSLLGFFVFLSFYTLRVNLSVAIIVMVNSTYLREREPAAAAAANVSTNSSTDHEPRAADHNSSAHDDDNVRVYSVLYK